MAGVGTMSEIYACCTAHYKFGPLAPGLNGDISIVIMRMEDLSVENFDGSLIVDGKNADIVFEQNTFYIDGKFAAEKIRPCLKLDGDFYTIG